MLSANKHINLFDYTRIIQLAEVFRKKREGVRNKRTYAIIWGISLSKIFLHHFYFLLLFFFSKYGKYFFTLLIFAACWIKNKKNKRLFKINVWCLKWMQNGVLRMTCQMRLWHVYARGSIYKLKSRLPKLI